MQRPVDALVTGFTKSPALLDRSMATLRGLKQEGVVRNIHCVTWDSAELDRCVAPLQNCPDVTLTRAPQPDAKGSPNQRGIVYQIENLKAALALIPDDPLILKWRPDVTAKHAFLREKITTFAQNAIVPPRACFGVAMPPPVLRTKIWIPWADSNSPFFYEDAVFLGEKRDVSLLAAAPAADDLEKLGDPLCGSYVHIMRYGRLFARHYPLLNGYFQRIHLFNHGLEYRRRSVPYLIDNGFFWHILVAHAWILHSQFHVDIGAAGDLAFYANAVNKNADWSDFSTLAVTSPYDAIDGWRTGTKAGMALPSVCRAFGRLMDDEWQKAFFTGSLPDLPRETVTALMTNIAGCGDGRLGEIERDFYRGLKDIFRQQALAS